VRDFCHIWLFKGYQFPTENRKVGGSTPPLATSEPVTAKQLSRSRFLLSGETIKLPPLLLPFLFSRTNARSVDNSRYFATASTGALLLGPVTTS
jgi:hypothetical protein